MCDMCQLIHTGSSEKNGTSMYNHIYIYLLVKMFTKDHVGMTLHHKRAKLRCETIAFLKFVPVQDVRVWPKIKHENKDRSYT